MDSSSLDAAYVANLDAYKNLGREVKFGLDQALADAGIKPHAVTFRVKELESLRAKADDKGWTDPLNEATDIVGARVVVPFQSDVPLAREVAKSTFKILKEENKSSPAEVSSFGYAGLHLDAQIRESHAGPRYNALKAFRFEVQIRTIVEDAWAAVSHILAYKGRSSIPEELQRDFYALSGLFYIADQHFELFHKDAVAAGRRATAQVAAAAAEPKKRRAKAIPLNADTLVAFINRTYADRDPADREAASSLMAELDRAGYTTMMQLQIALAKGNEAFAEYEVEHPPRGIEGNRFNGIGAVRMTLSRVDPRFDAIRRGSPIDDGSTNES